MANNFKLFILQRRTLTNNNDGGTNSSTEDTDAIWPPRKQDRHVETVEIGSMNVLSSKYEVCLMFVLLCIVIVNDYYISIVWVRRTSILLASDVIVK